MAEAKGIERASDRYWTALRIGEKSKGIIPCDGKLLDDSGAYNNNNNNNNNNNRA